METLPCLWLLLFMAAVPGKGVVDLNGTREIVGTWRSVVTLPCSYEPSPDFKEKSVVWKTNQQDHGLRTIFHRDDDSGDQTLLISFRGRLTVPKQPPGDVSLLIKDLEMADGGRYTCQVTWEAGNRSRITKERTTTLRIVKVPVTKPAIRLSHVASILPRGMRLTLTCSASGSPPIKYRWFKEEAGRNALRVGEGAVLTFAMLEPSHTGRYSCEAENRASSTSVQRSDPVRLTVEDLPVRTTQGPEVEEHTTNNSPVIMTLWPNSETKEHATRGPAATSTATRSKENTSERQVSRRAALPLQVVILIAVLCAVVVFAAISVVVCRRRTKNNHIYQVAYNNDSMRVGREEDPTPARPASPGVPGACECLYEEPNARVDNDYTPEPVKGSEYVVMRGEPGEDNEYELLVSKMESEYEVAEGQ